ncbi:hypothetical protein D3C86_1887160 [compost metagenome]
MRPDSILAISRMSPISASSELAESWATVIASRSSPSRFRASSSMPMMAFIGVRISWLMVARNRLLATLASSAWSLAWRNSATRRLRSVISTQPQIRPRMRCWAFR